MNQLTKPCPCGGELVPSRNYVRWDCDTCENWEPINHDTEPSA